MGERRATEIRKALEQDIVTGALAPGERLDETRMAARFAVSRTPVREALMELASTGLIRMRPRRGAVVSAVGLKDLVEMFETMAELEAVCGRLAARRMTPEQRAALQALHETCAPLVEAGDADAYYAANAELHEAIYAGTGNAFLREQTVAIRNRLSPYRRLQLRRKNRLRQSFEEHGRIVAAIADGDESAASERLRRHISVQSDSFADFLSNIPETYIASES